MANLQWHGPVSSENLLRRHWKTLSTTLTARISRNLANMAYERHDIHRSELDEIFQAKRLATQVLLTMMTRRSTRALAGFAEDLRNTSVNDIQNIGRRLQQDLGGMAPSGIEDCKSSLIAAAFYQLRLAAGQELEFEPGTMRWSWTRSAETLPDKFHFRGSTTSTFIDNHLLIARRGDATLHFVNTESDDIHITSLTTNNRPWAITQLFKMNNQCCALVKTGHGYDIVHYAGTTMKSITTVPCSDRNRISDMSAVASDTHIYIIGGTVGYSFYTTSEIWQYSPTERWKKISDMPTPRSLASCVVLGNNLIIGGGFIEFETSKMSNTVEVLDLFTLQWTTYRPTTMLGCQLVSLAGNLLAIGGKPQDPNKIGTNHVEMLDDCGRWVTLPPMNDHRIGHTVCDTPDMRVITAGGCGLKTIEILEMIPE